VGDEVRLTVFSKPFEELFAALVVLALFEFHGTFAFNDSGELDGQATYDEATLRQVIGSALASGKQYLAH